MAARISALQFDDGSNDQFRTVKCSGICVATGTGSTSWFRTIKSLCPDTVEGVLSKACPGKKYSSTEIEKIGFDFNSTIQYPAGWNTIFFFNFSCKYC